MVLLKWPGCPCDCFGFQLTRYRRLSGAESNRGTKNNISAWAFQIVKTDHYPWVSVIWKAAVGTCLLVVPPQLSKCLVLVNAASCVRWNLETTKNSASSGGARGSAIASARHNVPLDYVSRQHITTPLMPLMIAWVAVSHGRFAGSTSTRAFGTCVWSTCMSRWYAHMGFYGPDSTHSLANSLMHTHSPGTLSVINAGAFQSYQTSFFKMQVFVKQNTFSSGTAAILRGQQKGWYFSRFTLRNKRTIELPHHNIILVVL